MNQYEYLNNNNFQEKIFYNDNNEITEEINQSDSNNFSQLEQDIRILINYIRTNPLDFRNSLIRKNQYKQNPDEIEIIHFIEEIHQNQKLSEYTEIPELSSAARYLLDNISLHYKNNHNLNLKELEPNSLNLRARLSNYGERSGRIFETVLFKMDNPEDIVFHILREEKGRNMLLSHKMKYIGIACDMLPSNFMCTVIDIVQDFIPYRNIPNSNNININNEVNDNNYDDDNNSNNIYLMKNNSIKNKTYTNFSFNPRKNPKKYFYNQNSSEYISLIQNLNNKNSKDNLKLKIKVPHNQTKEIEMNLNNNEQIQNRSFNNNYLEIKLNNQKNTYYKTPNKIFQNNEDNYSTKSDNPNNIITKKIIPKRNNSNNINILLKKDSKNDNIEDIQNINNIKFTMAGRTHKQQQEIIEKSTTKNLNKSKSVCSFDVNSNYSRASNKNKFQRLNHEEKMEILHKINHRNNKTPNSQSAGSDKNSENAINLIANKITTNEYNKKNNNFEINFDNKSKKSPSRSTYNQDFYDINSDTEKNNFNNLNKYLNKYNQNNNNIYDDGTNQTFTDLKSNQGIGSNDDYSKNKINEIKNDLLYFKNQIKKELKDEVREEIKNEFNKKLLLRNKDRNKPTLIQLEQEFEFPNNYDEREKRNSYDLNNEINEKIYYKQNSLNNNYNRNKEKNRWSSVEKYYYIKNNNNNINNINNTNIILPDNEIQYSQYTQNNFHRNRKSFDLNEYINNNKKDRLLCKEKYEQLEYIPIINSKNEILNNQDNISNYSRGSYQNQNINKGSSCKKNIHESYFNEGIKMNNKQQIKKLIKLYNIAKEDKRNKSIIENSNIYDIINNNKSISNYNFNQKKSDNIKIDINYNLNNFNKIKINNNNTEKLKNDLRNNYDLLSNNLNNEEEETGENDFVKGHRFQIKYEKVKPKGQIYNKNLIPKPRNISVKKSNNNLINNINNSNIANESKTYINDNLFNKNEDIVNLGNTHLSNEKEDKTNKGNINEKNYKIEKTSHIKKYDETLIYNGENGQNQKFISDQSSINNNLNSNEKLSLTGKFVEENNNTESNNNLKSNESIDIKNFMNKNIVYNESKEKPIISKRETMDENNVVTTITTKTRKIYTPNKSGKNDEYIVNKKVQKKQSDLIKEYKKYERINKEIKDTRNNKNSNKIENKIITKKLSLGRKTFEKIKVNTNQKNKINYIEIENDTLKTPNQFKKVFHQYEKEFNNKNGNMSPRSNNNLSTKTSPYFKNKKYTPYPYYPYEYTINNKNNNSIIPSKGLNNNNNNNGNVEKKYIKDPEGNLIETYVKKTKYNDGSVLLEYI